MTDKPTPTDAELKAMWQIHAADIGGIFSYTRAVLAKWGQPAVAGEPDFYTACAWYEGGGVGEWIALPGYSNETEHGVKHLVLEAARNEGYKGTAAGRLLELGWEIRPVFLTPQPTHAQPVARELLTPERVKEIVRGAGYDQCGIPDTERAAFINGLRHGEREHGIKGGQHGTE